MNHGTTEPVQKAEPLEHRPSRIGSTVGWGMGLVSLLVVGGTLTARVKTKLDQKTEVAAERLKVEGESKRKIPTRTVQPESVRYRAGVDFTGTLRPWREADIAFETQGRLISLNVALGDTVRGGQLLGTLDASRAGAQVNQAQAQSKAVRAQLALAEDNLHRSESLVASKSIPEAQLEQARQNVALARAQVDAADATTRVAQVGQGVSAITAPFAGIVTKAPTSAGGVVNPGVPILRLEDVSRFRLMGSVGEDDVALVSIGAPVTVHYRDQLVSGKVSALVPSLDQATRRAPVEIEVPNNVAKPLLGYGFVRARIDAKEEIDALKLPPGARRSGAQDEVLVVRRGRVAVIKVVHSTLDDGSWIVRSGLLANDIVLLHPSSDLRDGDDPGELVSASADDTAPPPVLVPRAK
jgi:RND family efflux transporter MFP subunit